MTATPETGLDVLGAAAHARVKKMTYGVLAKNLGIAADTLVDFTEARSRCRYRSSTPLRRNFLATMSRSMRKSIGCAQRHRRRGLRGFAAGQ